MKERLIKLLKQADENSANKLITDYDDAIIDNAEYLIAHGVIVPPCKVGQTVYKICPKCNDRHNESCEHCAWCGCNSSGCDIGVKVYSDGSYNEKTLQIVPRKVTPHTIITIFELWGIMYFATEEEANAAKAEYDTIRNIQDRRKRYKKYKEWETKRKTYYAFLKGGAE